MIEGNELLPTVNGWLRAVDVRIGDILFDKDGLPCKVTEATIETPPEVWKMVTAPGYTLRMTHIPNNYKNNYKRYLTRAPALEMPAREQLVDPYVFGLWFFDHVTVGKNKGLSIPVKREQLNKAVTALNNSGFGIFKRREVKIKKNAGVNVRFLTVPDMWAYLRPHYYKKPDLIPDEYLYASLEQKQRLLDSFLDAHRRSHGMDHKCKLHKWVMFSNEKLTMQMAELIESLGYSIALRYHGKRNRVSFMWDPRPAKTIKSDAIKTMEPYKQVPCVNIKTTSSTYVATERRYVIFN